MNNFWKDVTYFIADEFDSPDLPGSGRLEINPHLVVVLEKVRREYGKPISINSAYRTREHNERVGGVVNSQHRKGNAADLSITNQKDGDILQALFIKYAGEKCGIGRYNTFIHVDVRNKKSRWDKRT